MNSFSYKVKNIINKYGENEIIIAKDIYNSYFKNANENLFYKVLERLCNINLLKRIGKGVYIKPKISKYGEIPISNNKLIEFFTKENSGMNIGYSLYNAKGITTQTPVKYKILSTNIYENKKSIKDIEIIKIPFKVSEERKEAIEILEIIENSKKIEDLNYDHLIKVINKYVSKYNDKEVNFVLKNIKYKKSTIASLKHFLDINNIKNSLGNSLSSLSKYKLLGE